MSALALRSVDQMRSSVTKGQGTIFVMGDCSQRIGCVALNLRKQSAIFPGPNAWLNEDDRWSEWLIAKQSRLVRVS